MVIKRLIALTLILAFGAVCVPKSSANSMDLPSHSGTLMPDFLDDFFKGVVGTVRGWVFKEELAKSVAKELNLPIESITFEGGHLAYEYHSYNSIKIGEYVFDSYEFGTPITPGCSFRYRDVFEKYNRAKLYYIPFFIYKSDLYFEYAGPWNGGFAYQLGYYYRGVYAWANNEFLGTTLFGQGVQSGSPTFDMFRINRASNFATVSESQSGNSSLSHWGWGLAWDSSTPSNRQWVNVSRYVNNISQIHPNPTNNIMTTVSQITQGDSLEFVNNNLHNFSPNQAGTGVFIVPPTFFESSGMNLWEYIGSLDPNELWQTQPPSTHRVEVPLPPELHDLGDDDEVTITVDEDGNINVHVVQVEVNNENNNVNNNNSDNGGIISAIVNAPKALIGFLGDLLKKLFIPREDYFDNHFEDLNERLHGKIPVLAQIGELLDSVFWQFGNASEELPEFKIEIFEQSVDIIDFQLFTYVRIYVHSLIIFLAYWHFIRRLVRKMPKAIGGIEQ